MNPEPEREQSLFSDDDAWLDEVLRETFPASDPVPMRHKDVPVNDWPEITGFIPE